MTSTKNAGRRDFRLRLEAEKELTVEKVVYLKGCGSFVMAGDDSVDDGDALPALLSRGWRIKKIIPLHNAAAGGSMSREDDAGAYAILFVPTPDEVNNG